VKLLYVKKRILDNYSKHYKVKKIRLFAILMVVVLHATTMVSCSSNDVEEPVVGIWVLTEWIKTDQSSKKDSVVFYEKFQVSERVSPMIFNADGTGVVTLEDEIINVDWTFIKDCMSIDWVSVRSECFSFGMDFILVNSTTLIFKEIHTFLDMGVVTQFYITRTWTKIQ
jgi:hypothetical protein